MSSAHPLESAGQAPAPIADTSYRNYDGPLRPPRFGWWIVARMMTRLAWKRKGFWVLLFFSLMPYLLPAFLLYIRSQDQTRLLDMLAQRSFSGIFYDAFAGAQLWIFLLALLVGAASISGDNRANALQIYLSKPLTKNGYLLGKWAGIFWVLAAASLLPAGVLYLYCWGSFTDEGFLSENPYLWLQVLVATLLPPALHASFLLGVSAWFKRPLLAGGIYAGIYFGSQILAGIVSLILRRVGQDDASVTALHFSVPGVLRGLGQHLFDTLPGFYGLPIRAASPMSQSAKPELLPLLLLCGGLILLGLVLARVRVRAVEVVRG